MIFVPGSYRRTKADTGRIIAALEAKLGQYPGETDLANGEAWLSVLRVHWERLSLREESLSAAAYPPLVASDFRCD